MIKTNKIKCKKCGDVIESTYRHDFVTCKCGSVSVDGGRDYLKRSGDMNDYVEMSVDDGKKMKVVKEKKGKVKQLKLKPINDGYWKSYLDLAYTLVYGKHRVVDGFIQELKSNNMCINVVEGKMRELFEKYAQLYNKGGE